MTCDAFYDIIINAISKLWVKYSRLFTRSSLINGIETNNERKSMKKYSNFREQISQRNLSTIFFFCLFSISLCFGQSETSNRLESKIIQYGFRAGFTKFEHSEIGDYLEPLVPIGVAKEISETKNQTPFVFDLNLRLSKLFWANIEIFAGLNSESIVYGNNGPLEKWQTEAYGLFLGGRLQKDFNHYFLYSQIGAGPIWSELNLSDGQSKNSSIFRSQDINLGARASAGAGILIISNISLFGEIGYRFAYISELKDHYGNILQYKAEFPSPDVLSPVSIGQSQTKLDGYKNLPLNFNGFQFSIGIGLLF